MSHIFFSRELEGVATFWRIFRRDGVTLGFTSHDRDLRFDGVDHRAAPGMLPSAIRRNSGLEADSAEIQGALTSDAISAADLEQGRFDGARVLVGAVDWETLERHILYSGSVGTVRQDATQFTAELKSAKSALDADLIPRTSPTCRAEFCGPGCALNASRFTHEAKLSTIDAETNAVAFSTGPASANMLDGSVRWVDGPQAGLTMHIVDLSAEGLILDTALDPHLMIGTSALLFEGCDHRLATCHSRFDNAVNFQGEPYLPGNDILARYPASRN